jgi:hypothetical protein
MRSGERVADTRLFTASRTLFVLFAWVELLDLIPATSFGQPQPLTPR